MNTKLIIIIAATIAITAFFFTNFKETPHQPTVELRIIDYPKESFVGQTTTITAKATAESTVEKITLSYQQTQKEMACQKHDCTVQFQEDFQKQGTFELELTATSAQGEKATKKIAIKVFQKQKTCIDQTVPNTCSTNKPFFCLNDSLVENCTQCGCPSGMQCGQNSCTPIAQKLEIKSATALPAKIIKENTAFSIKATLENTGQQTVQSGAQYTIITELNGPKQQSTQKQFSLTTPLQENDKTEVTIDQNGLPQGKYELNLYIMGGGETTAFFEQNFLESSNETTPPLAPTGITTRLEGETLVLSWAPNTEPDIAGYKIFKSITSQPTHTAYSLHQTVGKDTTSIQITGLENKKHFFVLKAFDFLSNESGFSQIIKVDKS